MGHDETKDEFDAGSEVLSSTAVDTKGKTPEQVLEKLALDPAEGVLGPDGRVLCAAGRGTGLRFIGTYFPEAQHDLRIASSFFTIAGFDLGRHFVLPSAKMRVLVGQHQGQAAKSAVAQEMVAVLRTIMTELGTTCSPLATAVSILVERIEAGKFTFHSAHAMPDTNADRKRRFHCKIYISDDVVVCTGSPNFTGNGLHRYGNEEQMVASRDAVYIRYLTDYFDEQVTLGHDLLKELLELLKQWLGMHEPFMAYLKALYSVLYEDPYPIEGRAKVPTYWQEGIIVRALEQAKEHSGVLLLVATGLGKTVIGAEIARRLLVGQSGHARHQMSLSPPAALKMLGKMS